MTICPNLDLLPQVNSIHVNLCSSSSGSIFVEKNFFAVVKSKLNLASPVEKGAFPISAETQDVFAQWGREEPSAFKHI